MAQEQQQKNSKRFGIFYLQNCFASSSIEQHLKISRGLFSEQKRVNSGYVAEV
jgi:hypothetical protein